ncbi:MAG: S4 domain-containing protein [Prolixibacteraceae bacterium]|nr:S4 domain-containing protein [Prolixibacteraceae bacterium]NLO01684.1 RNA-binding S4 domain-containing protein [Bacteroidales bacterium]
MDQKVRIDKWLWAVRIYKTRSKASEACSKGHVLIGNIPVKPSKEIRKGDIVRVKHAAIYKSYKVIEPVYKRLSASLITEFVEDITPPDELEKLELQKKMKWFSRKPGLGRPTKKERRDMDDFLNYQSDD